jgi:hypothetical protein
MKVKSGIGVVVAAVASLWGGFLGLSLTAKSPENAPSGTAGSAPAYLDILSASMVELSPEVPGVHPDDVVNRKLALRMELAGAPPCAPGPSFLGYCFLLDTDKDPLTGTTHPAFGDLGIDARICAECDPAAGSFKSPLGEVTISTDPGTGVTTVEILTMVGLLPSIDFRWIAAAQEDSTFVRLPALPEYEEWTTLERSRH